MNSLREAIERVESLERSLEVYTEDETDVAELREQFATRNVSISHEQIADEHRTGFVILRNADGSFEGSMRLDAFQAILSPSIDPPWQLEGALTARTGLFEFLDELLFTSYDRRQMLATAREIEERAWRVNAGTLYAGFQRATAFRAQTPVYARFAMDRSVSVRILIDDEWTGPTNEAITVVAAPTEEIGQFWFVIFDGGDDDLNTCGMLAEERDPGRYYGFWTYDPALVAELVAYLESTYFE